MPNLPANKVAAKATTRVRIKASSGLWGQLARIDIGSWRRFHRERFRLDSCYNIFLETYPWNHQRQDLLWRFGREVVSVVIHFRRTWTPSEPICRWPSSKDWTRCANLGEVCSCRAVMESIQHCGRIRSRFGNLCRHTPRTHPPWMGHQTSPKICCEQNCETDPTLYCAFPSAAFAPDKARISQRAASKDDGWICEGTSDVVWQDSCSLNEGHDEWHHLACEQSFQDSEARLRPSWECGIWPLRLEPHIVPVCTWWATLLPARASLRAFAAGGWAITSFHSGKGAGFSWIFTCFKSVAIMLEGCEQWHLPIQVSMTLMQFGYILYPTVIPVIRKHDLVPCSLIHPRISRRVPRSFQRMVPLQWWPRWMDRRPIYCLSWRDLARLHSLQGGSCRAAMAPKIKRPCFGRSFTKDLF